VTIRRTSGKARLACSKLNRRTGREEMARFGVEDEGAAMARSFLASRMKGRSRRKPAVPIKTLFTRRDYDTQLSGVKTQTAPDARQSLCRDLKGGKPERLGESFGQVCTHFHQFGRSG
jgi:hypothetical protein